MNCSTVDSAGPFFFSLRVVGCTFEKVFFDSLLEAVLMGYIVAVLTSRMLSALRELVHERRWLRVLDILLCDGSVYDITHISYPIYMKDVLFIIWRVFRGAVAFVGTLHFSATLLGCSWSTPGQPNRHIWMMEFWLVWLLNLVCLTASCNNNRQFAWSYIFGFLDPEGEATFKWSLLWGVLGMVFKLVVELDHLALTAVAATASFVFASFVLALAVHAES